MAAHRYWRIYITANQGDSYTSLYEFHPVYNGAPVGMSGVTATSSSAYSTNTADKTIDGSTTIGWISASGNMPCWLQYDFGAGNAVDIDGFLMWPFLSGYPNRAPKDFVIQSSDNGVDWTDVITVTNQPANFLILHNIAVTGRAVGVGIACDLEDGGAYQITGTVTELGTSGPYRVSLFDRSSKRCIRETWSATDGSYLFPYIAYRVKGYFAVAYDHGASPLNAAIADFITPEPMP